MIKMEAEYEIEDEKDDLLNRDDFAHRLSQSITTYKSEKSLTIGIMGSWGSGKSSLINLTVNHLKKENNIIIRFSPWFFSNQENLFLQFFKLIISTLKNKKDNENLFERMITPKRMLFESPENPLKEYFNYIKDESLNGNFNIFEYSNDLESYDSIKYHKNQCKKYINDFKSKIIVILDDIDRLTNSEIAQVFTLVKSLADFDNFIYILSFDELIVTKALNSLNSEYKDDFIDKIINIPINIPKISESKIEELIRANIKPIYDNQLEKNFKNYNNNFKVIEKYLKIFIKNIRDLKRYQNILNFYLDNIVDDLNIDDLFLILIIQLFDHELFLKIKNNQDQLINDSAFINETNPNTMISIPRFNEKFIETLGAVKWEKYQNLLVFLFPLLKTMTNPISKNRFNEWVDNHKICCEKYFEKYFTISLDTNEASDAFIELLIEKNNEHEIYSSLTKRNNPEYNNSLFYKLSDKILNIPPENSEFFIKALLRCGDEIKSYRTSREYIPQILHELFMKIPSEKRFELMKKCIEYPDNVFTISEFIYSLIYEYNVTDEKIMEIKSSTVEKIRKSSKNKNFFNMNFLQDMLFYWKHLDDVNTVIEDVLHNVKTDDEIIAFMKKFRTKKDDSLYIIGGGSEAHLVLDLDELKIYHGLETYEKVVKNTMNNQNISEEDKEICEIFLKQYEENKLREDLLR